MSHLGGPAECWMISLWPRSLCFYYTHKICVSPHLRNGFDEPCTFQRPISWLELPGTLAGRPQSPDPGAGPGLRILTSPLGSRGGETACGSDHNLFVGFLVNT